MSRGAGRSESSSAATATPPQVKVCVQALRRITIPGARVPRPPGSSWLPAGSPRAAPRARSLGAEPVHGPGSRPTSHGRGRRLGRPPAPPQVPMRPQRRKEGRCIG
ncbi:hypothetical protein NDU88_006043 [Pleurodeles waltl]|uniref:Uncharacterized protein n=1 Tax=Pleurodeles waltl TaxID=8319 RepID=A0AAV7NRY1_PLEWA|nr:hypothetical protein NDU88_006043 [Pleurodeles waltl]